MDDDKRIADHLNDRERQRQKQHRRARPGDWREVPVRFDDDGNLNPCERSENSE